jgi:NAD(P)-dependent dehydrogenase (short-subunit alcohol dehydrogenase family)
MESKKEKKLRKPQSQNRPGNESKMSPKPVYDNISISGSGKLKGKVAVITGADSGIGRAVAVLFAKEGASVVVVYLSEHNDAKITQQAIEHYNSECLLIAGDISKESFCTSIISKTIKKFGKLDILINNAGVHYESKSLTDISTAQLTKTFATNIFSMFWLTKAALAYLKKGSNIINTASVTAYRGSDHLIDYAATKGAIVSFTRSLSANLVKKGIRVNAVAPGPIWTPLIASTLKPADVAKFGSSSPMERAGEPYEVAAAYLFLASSDASFITGQTIHVNGGEIVNG